MLPLLQYGMNELFEQSAGQILSLDAYRMSGGVRSALVRRADELFDSLDSEGQAAARQLFLRLVTLGEGTEDTRRRGLQAALTSIAGPAGVIDEGLEAFGLYRLLTFARDPVTPGP